MVRSVHSTGCSDERRRITLVSMPHRLGKASTGRVEPRASFAYVRRQCVALIQPIYQDCLYTARPKAPNHHEQITHGHVTRAIEVAIARAARDGGAQIADDHKQIGDGDLVVTVGVAGARCWSDGLVDQDAEVVGTLVRNRDVRIAVSVEVGER